MKIGLALFALLLPGLAWAAGITGQDALYTLNLSKLRTHDITGATGQMSFKIVDGCTGWGTTQHMTLIVRNVDGTLSQSMTNYVTWESKNGKRFTFSVSERDNGGKSKIDDEGTAIHTGQNDAGIVHYTVPAGKVVYLPPGTLFPMAHTEAMLAAGREGKKFIAPLLFDGTTTAGAQATFVGILAHHGPEKTTWPVLNDIPSTNVDIAFFPRTNKDEIPDFRTRIRYFENGVGTGMVLDFGDFEMTGKLTKLGIPPSPCKG